MGPGVADEDWAGSQYGVNMEIEILNPDRLRDWCGRIDVPAEALDELIRIAGVVNADDALLKIFTDFHVNTAVQGNWPREWAPLPVDPAIQAAFGEQASMFYVLAYLSALPYVDQKYTRLGVDPQIFRATMYDFRRYLIEFKDVHDHWGYDQFMWIWRHLDCELFRLGRLQYMLIPFEGGVTALRNRSNGKGIVLADPNTPLRADGYAVGAGLKEMEREKLGDLKPADAWSPVFEETSQGWTGHPAGRDGRVDRETRFYSKNDWEVWVRHNDWVLDMHIPHKDPLTVEACRDSLCQAYDFFPRIYPERQFKAGFCHTWFFTPQLQYLLPANSTILAFTREFQRYPHAGGPEYLWGFVFGAKYPDPATAPRDTSLRRAVLDWVAEGKELFDIPGLLLLNQPEDWGCDSNS
jgi:hypothetical protein